MCDLIVLSYCYMSYIILLYVIHHTAVLLYGGPDILVTCVADTSARLIILIIVLDARTELRLCWYY